MLSELELLELLELVDVVVELRSSAFLFLLLSTCMSLESSADVCLPF